jgi:hypothetical protein
LSEVFIVCTFDPRSAFFCNSVQQAKSIERHTASNAADSFIYQRRFGSCFFSGAHSGVSSCKWHRSSERLRSAQPHVAYKAQFFPSLRGSLLSDPALSKRFWIKLALLNSFKIADQGIRVKVSHG